MPHHYEYPHAPPEMDFDSGDLLGALIIGGGVYLMLDSVLSEEEDEYRVRVQMPSFSRDADRARLREQRRQRRPQLPREFVDPFEDSQ